MTRSRVALFPVLAAVTVAWLPLPASAAGSDGRGRGERVLTHEYIAPNGFRLSHSDDLLREVDLPPMVFRPRPSDRYVMFEFDDATGSLGYVRLFQPGPRGMDYWYCGWEGVFELRSSRPIEVDLYAGVCENHLIGHPTRGTITVTFSSHRLGDVGRSEHDHLP